MKNFAHLTLRGNYHQTICYDRDDYINFWNRIILSAYDTEVKLLALELLSNHFHLVVSYESETLERFKRHLRMSLTHYFNKRYEMHGTLGARKMVEVRIIDPAEDGGRDLKDVISYTLRNILRHGLLDDIWKYPWSTIRIPFSTYNTDRLISIDDIPSYLAIKYFPGRVNSVPKSFMVSKDGMLHPLPVMDIKTIEDLFRTKSQYVGFLSMNSDREIRYKEEEQEGRIKMERTGSKSAKRKTITDDEIISYLTKQTADPSLLEIVTKHNIIQMTLEEKKKCMVGLKQAIPYIQCSQLSRIFGIPWSTVKRC